MSKKFMITVNGNSYEVTVDEIKEDGTVVAPVKAPAAPAVSAAPVAPKAASAASGKKICAPMPGAIVKINVKAGDKFSKGDVVAVIEAMKMENEITAPEDGIVADVAATQGSTVDTGAAIIIYN